MPEDWKEIVERCIKQCDEMVEILEQEVERKRLLGGEAENVAIRINGEDWE